MTVRSNMRTALQGVIATLGEAWEYRRLTSGPAAQSRTYGAWTAVTAHVTGRINSEDFEETRSSHTRHERGRFRVADSLILHQGDQVRDTTTTINNPNLYWAVMGVESSSVGTIAYTITRDIPLRVEANRGGGV